MIRSVAPLWRETVAGLALLFCVSALADDAIRENYVLIEYPQGPNAPRLLVFTTRVPEPLKQRLFVIDQDDYATALEMTRSADSRARVRGLTLLSGVDHPLALDAAMVLLTDPVTAVREEAFQLVLEHPHADIAGALNLALDDPSARVREAASELMAEQSGD